MHDPSQNTPAGLLFATDLSARCDRPLERASQLAGEFSTPLVTLMVFDTPQAPGDVLQWRDADTDRQREAAAAPSSAARLFPNARITASCTQDSDILADDAFSHAAFARFLDTCGFTQNHASDLAVPGLHDQSALQRLLTGSRSGHLQQEVACHTLLARPGELQ